METLKVEITVKVCEDGKDRYSDPSGYETIELLCQPEDIGNIVKTSDTLVSSLVTVCYVKLREELKKQEQESEQE